MASGWSSAKFCERALSLPINGGLQRPSCRPLVINKPGRLIIIDKAARLVRLFSSLLVQHYGAAELA
jgi:hypothetical protein